MTAAVVALSIALALATGAIVAIARWLKSALDGQGNAVRLYQDERQVADTYLLERDAAMRGISASDARERDLKRRLAAVELERNGAYAKAANDIADRVRNGSSADAASVIDRLLEAPLPGMPETVPAAAGGPDGHGAASVQPADAAAAGNAGRGA